MHIEEAILFFYIISIALSVAGLTGCVLTGTRKKTVLGKRMIGFMTGLLVMCFYDMTIYYSNYILGILSNVEVMRIGNCIIAGTMWLWILLEQQIIRRNSLRLMNRMVMNYLAVYAGVWLVLTIALSLEQFYTLKWLLLITDLLLIILFLTVSIAHIVYAGVAEEKTNVYYLTLITAMLLFNYISYFWSETSVYWGNSEFIREPMDLTIILWLAINVINMGYSYKMLFKRVIDKEVGAGPDESPAGTDKPEDHHKELEDRIEELREQYHLTPRETEFVELIYHGKSNKEIADMLFLSESTVKTHIYNIFRKMDVKSRVSVICIINNEEGPDDQQEPAQTPKD